ncbi:MAG: hypothetical protein ABIK13_01680 [Patescibacteria group bacterium]
MPDLTSLVDRGILIEDQFIDTYMKVIRDEGFLDSFGTHQDEARELLATLIGESRSHRAGLERLKTIKD